MRAIMMYMYEIFASFLHGKINHDGYGYYGACLT